MGTASCSETDSGKCVVGFGSSPPTKDSKSNYNVLYTDYKNVSMVYGCSESWLGKTESAFILTRDWNISEAQIDSYEE